MPINGVVVESVLYEYIKLSGLEGILHEAIFDYYQSPRTSIPNDERMASVVFPVVSKKLLASMVDDRFLSHDLHGNIHSMQEVGSLFKLRLLETFKDGRLSQSRSSSFFKQNTFSSWGHYIAERQSMFKNSEDIKFGWTRVYPTGCSVLVSSGDAKEPIRVFLREDFIECPTCIDTTIQSMCKKLNSSTIEVCRGDGHVFSCRPEDIITNIPVKGDG